MTLTTAQTAALDLALSAYYDAVRWPDHFSEALTPGEGVRGATLQALEARGLLVSEPAKGYRLTEAGKAEAVRLRKQTRALRDELHNLLYLHRYADTHTVEEERASEVWFRDEVSDLLDGATVRRGESIEAAALRLLGNRID